MSRIATVEIEGIISYHLPGWGGDGCTMCGIDGGLSSDNYGQRLVKTPRGAKINCPTCKRIWDTCRKFSHLEFECRI